MQGANDDAILHALASEVRKAAWRLQDFGWHPDDAWRLASEAADQVGAGWPGWERVDKVREAFS
jgi:hypothetical protein